MAFFPRFVSASPADIRPLFRLLDDALAPALAESSGRCVPRTRSFTPSFDIKETKTGFELQGELPGVEQKDVAIEFVDPTTLVIKGRTEKHSESSSTPATPKAVEASEAEKEVSHKATVEDEPEYESVASPSSATEGEATPTATTTETAAVEKSAEEPKQPRSRYWISERSVGEFHRSFRFPATIDQERVSASLKNGILSVVIPKREERAPRKIEIN